MSDEIRRITAHIQVGKETAGGGFVPPSWLPIMMGLQPDPRTPEQQAQDRARYEAASARRREQIEEAHAAALSKAPSRSFRYVVLELHAPHISSGGYAECEGCDFAGYEGEPPEWPCRTYVLARDWA